MSLKHERILKPSSIPSSLWNKKESTLYMPTILAEAYIQIIDSNGLRELGCTRQKGMGPVGGLSKEESDTHFAQAFDGSSARTLLALLDPNSEVGSTSDTFFRCLAGGNICLTDAPCGAGASAFTFLTAIAQLRAENVLPRTPLNIQLIGAEISEFARGYAININDLIKDKLEKQAIFVETVFMPSDVTNCINNTDLISVAITKSNDKNHKLLVVANFNGFLEGSGKRKEAEPQLQELFRFASGENSFAIWIEPNMNSVTRNGGLFPSIWGWFKQKKWKSIGRPDVQEEKPMFTANAKFCLPLIPTQTARVSLAVVPFILDRNK